MKRVHINVACSTQFNRETRSISQDFLKKKKVGISSRNAEVRISFKKKKEAVRSQIHVN